MHHPTDRIAHTTAFVTPVVEHWLEREIAQWVHHGRIDPMTPSHSWANALTTELHLAPKYTEFKMSHSVIEHLFPFLLEFVFKETKQHTHNMHKNLINQITWTNNKTNKTNTKVNKLLTFIMFYFRMFLENPILFLKYQKVALGENGRLSRERR